MRSAFAETHLVRFASHRRRGAAIIDRAPSRDSRLSKESAGPATGPALGSNRDPSAVLVAVVAPKSMVLSANMPTVLVPVAVAKPTVSALATAGKPSAAVSANAKTSRVQFRLFMMNALAVPVIRYLICPGRSQGAS